MTERARKIGSVDEALKVTLLQSDLGRSLNANQMLDSIQNGIMAQKIMSHLSEHLLFTQYMRHLNCAFKLKIYKVSKYTKKVYFF